MRNYSFDEITDRRHTNSVKWDTPQGENILPMWVADMDFKAAPCIIEALQRRVAHGVFGYTKVPAEYYEAIINWFERRHRWHIDRDAIIYTTGVVPAISAILKGLTKPGDGVLLQTPVYNCFYSSIRNNECRLVTNPLIYSEKGDYTIDFDDLDRKASEARVMILCNPHNPAGRVWTPEELTRIAEICKRHDVIVLSDEIHCELTYPGHDYTPFALIAEKTGVRYVVANSPSKAFNIAGLQIANIISPEDDMRNRIDRAININEVCDVNPFGVCALMAAYDHGGEWLDDLRAYIYDNYKTALAFFETRLPMLTVTPLEGTYLMWINIEATGMDADDVSMRLLDKGKVMVSPGSIYGPGGENFIRLNLACPRSVLLEGLERIASALL